MSTTPIISVTPPNLLLVKAHLTYSNSVQATIAKQPKYKITIELSVESDSSEDESKKDKDSV